MAPWFIAFTFSDAIAGSIVNLPENQFGFIAALSC